MDHDPTTPERRLIEQLLETLGTLPDVHPDPPRWASIVPGTHRLCDAAVDLVVAGKPFTLLIDAQRTLYPRDVRQVLWQLRQFSRSSVTKLDGDEPVSILVAEAISPGAKDLLRNERVGYYDSGGSLFVPAHGAYLFIDKPPPKTLAKSVRSLFSGRRAQVLQALLVRPRDWFGGKELAEEAQVSQATVSEVLSELERFDWVISRGQGPGKERQVKEPATILDTWAKQLSALRQPNLRRFYVPSMKNDKLLESIDQAFGSHNVEYAISYEAAAQCYAPFLSVVSQVRCRVIPGPTADSALSDLGARVVNEGANLAIIEAKSSGELLFRERVSGAWLANPIQVYLDLLRGEGRAKEMAEHMRKERIGF